MTITRLLDICTAYDKLGWSVQAQIKDVVAGNEELCNPSALEHIAEFLRVIERHADANGDDELRTDVEELLHNVTYELDEPKNDEVQS